MQIGLKSNWQNVDIQARTQALEPMPSHRRLNIAPEIIRDVPKSQLDQLRAMVDDEDNRCCICDGFIDGPEAEVVMFLIGDGKLKYVRYSHPACRRTGVYLDVANIAGWGDSDPRAEDSAPGDHDGTRIGTLFAVRDVKPRALLLVELTSSVSTEDEPDPYVLYAKVLGLSPITDAIGLTPIHSLTKSLRLRNEGDHLSLRHDYGTDRLALKDDQIGWLEMAREDRQILFLAGLGIVSGGTAQALEDSISAGRCWGGIIDYEADPAVRSETHS